MWWPDGDPVASNHPACRLIGPTAPPGHDPLASLVHRVSALHVPALNIRILKRFHNSRGIGHPSLAWGVPASFLGLIRLNHGPLWVAYRAQ